MSLSYGLVPHLSKKLSKLPPVGDSKYFLTGMVNVWKLKLYHKGAPMKTLTFYFNRLLFEENQKD